MEAVVELQKWDEITKEEGVERKCLGLQRTFDSVWRWGEMLLSPPVKRPGVLLCISQGTGHFPCTKSYQLRVSVMLRLKNPG